MSTYIESERTGGPAYSSAFLGAARQERASLASRIALINEAENIVYREIDQLREELKVALRNTNTSAGVTYEASRTVATLEADIAKLEDAAENISDLAIPYYERTQALAKAILRVELVGHI